MKKFITAYVSILLVACGGSGPQKQKQQTPNQDAPSSNQGDPSKTTSDGGRGTSNQGSSPKSDSNSSSQEISECIAGQLTQGPLGSSFSCIPAGTFLMGSPDSETGRKADEGPQHHVTITKDFQMQTTEVTQSQWVALMGSNPSHRQEASYCPDDFTTTEGIPLCPNYPIESVSWEDAQLFITRLNANGEGYVYRLPTEAEWEYAARAGTDGAYAGDVDAMAWFFPNSSNSNFRYGITHSVGKKMPNAWGLYDVHGNVREWTADWYGMYSAASVIDPLGPSTGPHRVSRGGGYRLSASRCRSAIREEPYGTAGGAIDLGFRLVRTKH